ncbi:GNAT family N-acetyltransferase [Nocardiopsis suaedae]|uniref:GNAT family N-acetyltransferase n=1 Tax=Nocardiopsis suaedae TaxID=3018444 RepID=A0ABT4TPB2_9ACTN|nr:GNAT family N-acetyltransferase [Nocardiopsis suaedae]MDA2806119.1 GNAT family N-acetyltransferase [Nocardiopsis suaedae]
MTDPSAPATGAAPVRPATEADLPAIADTLADAFADYPWTRWAVPADGYAERLRALQLYFAERIGLPYGRVWTTADHAAASVWTVPDTEIPADLFTSPELAALYGDRLPEVGRADALLEAHRPHRPCWFLATVGVRRDRQGEGLGRAVVEPGLHAADAAGAPVFLETATADNVRIYRRLGFEVTAEVDLPGGAPTTWCMERGPGST